MSNEKTLKNLEAAFSGESQANRKYLAFAKKADAEGFHQVAMLFRAAAEAETIHAHTHLATMGGIGSTEENLKAAVEGETYEFTSMYPSFIEDAAAEGQKRAERSFRLANEAEKVHAELFVKAAKEPSAGKEFDYYLCTVCGHIAEGSAPSECPLCGAAEKAYRVVK
ncbi:MAG TPA: rubrerythrin family protein [Synergistales bacterium]|jgi:rubrerythrin|nr:rubrerythrin family protein [Synergistales bacterium]HRV70754.1 rubrerythrin family protein [Thermovirgaceae bacterium]